MPRAKKILALASYATLALSAACQSQAPAYQLEPVQVTQSAPSQDAPTSLAASLPAEAAPSDSAAPKPGAVYIPPTQPLTDAEGRPASGNVLRRKVSSQPNAKPKRPLVDRDERPASGNVMSRTAASDF